MGYTLRQRDPMSSLSRGATGANKPKPVNVNSLFAGRNLTAGAKPLGKHGLTSVGKSVGVVRRMPPPATLPSLKAENNGQDPNTAVVPQGGSGWSKNEASTESSDAVKTSLSSPSSGPDLRPTWAKPPSDALSSNGNSSTREFPTLAVAAQGADALHKSLNKWVIGDNSNANEPKSSTSVTTSGEMQMLPSRCTNNSSDAMDSSPRHHTSERARFRCARESRDEIDIARRDADRISQPSRMPRATEFFDGGEDVQAEESGRVHESDRDDAIGKSRHKRTSFQRNVDDCVRNRPIMNMEKRLNFEDVSDEDDDIQMTKLDKPNVRIVKRVPESNGISLNENADDSLRPPEAVVGSVSNELRPPNESCPEANDQQFENMVDVTLLSDSNPADEGLPVSSHAENVWAKRQEERESQEKEKLSRMPKIMQQAIEQHFPSVSEAALIKVDKDATRRPADTDFARAALRARRQQGSNDVRQLFYSEEVFQRRTAPRAQRSDNECDLRGQSSTKIAPKDQRHQEIREGTQVDFWNRGGRRQIVTRGRYARTRGRTAALVQPRRSSANKKVGKESSAQPPFTSEDNMEPRRHDGRSYYSGVGENTASVLKQKTRCDSSKNVAKLSQKHVENVAYDEHDNNEDSNRVSPQREDTTDRRPTNRHQNKSFAQRGQARKGRGQHHYYRSGCEEYPSQRHTRLSDSGVASTTGHTVHSLSQANGKHDVQQHRSRRKFDFHQKSHPHAKSLGQERANRLRSPVVSSEGYDEWETASESSARATRENLSDVAVSSGRTSYRQTNSSAASLKPNSSNSHQGANHSASSKSTSFFEDPSAPTNSERSHGSKNAQPASRTCQSPSGSYNNCKVNKENYSRNVSDALAGLDINNIASVVVIDDHLVDTASVDASEEFEEVLNKRAKKQKALQMQAKLEAEENRKLKEKERHFRVQGKKFSRQSSNRKDSKKNDSKMEQKKDIEIVSGAADQKATPKQRDKNKAEPHVVEDAPPTLSTNDPMPVNENAELHREVPVTTVWNSAHIAEQKESIDGAPSIIPSPIARPNPRSKSATSDTTPSLQDLVRRQIVELPVSLSSSQPLRGDKYDFTFDPRLHEEQMSNEKVLTSLSTGASSEAGSMTDDFRLKEKLYKVKGLWSGEEKDSVPNLPSNVAKVKPQPQSGVEHLQNDGKPAASVPNGCHAVPPKSPGIAPFPSGLGGLMFSPYPVMFGDVSISRGYTSIGSVVQPLIPPSNASSPPVGQPLYQQPSLAATATMNHRPLQIRSNFMDQNAIFAMPPSQNMSWNMGSMLENNGSVALSGTPSPQLPQTHLSSSVQPPPSLILHHRGPTATTITQNHSQSLPHGYGMGVSSLAVTGGHLGPPPPPSTVATQTTIVPPPPIPPPELMNIPPPIGSQRMAPMTIQYAGFPPPPPLTNAVHPSHNFSQPPPNVRFAHPPPNQDSQWDKNLTRSFAGLRPHFTMFPGHSSPQMNAGRPNPQGHRWGMNTSHSSLSSSSQVRSTKMPVVCVGRVPCSSGVEGKTSCSISPVKSCLGQGSRGN